MPLEKPRYSFADYLIWDEKERIELIAGEPVMQAAPSSEHQIISGELYYQIRRYLEGKNCRVIAAPFAVRLFEKEGDTPDIVQTVLEPDISVICDKSKIDHHGCKGAPDMVIEILSSSTVRHDKLVKLNLYQKAGVREYWVVSPEEQSVQVFLLENGLYRVHELYRSDDIAKVHVLDGCFIELSSVFPNEDS